MFRRSAVEAAGLFEEALQACEDVDLAWRIFLLGYQLGYEPQAEVVHYDLNTWHRFVRKGAVYGAGAASLALAYGAHGASNKSPHRLSGAVARSGPWPSRTTGLDTTVSGCNYDSALPGHSLPDRSVRFVTSSGQRLRGRTTARGDCSVRASFLVSRRGARVGYRRSIQRLGFGGCWNLSRLHLARHRRWHIPDGSGRQDERLLQRVSDDGRVRLDDQSTEELQASGVDPHRLGRWGALALTRSAL